MKKERIWLNRRIERAVFILVLLWISVPHSQGVPKVPLYIHQKEIRVEVAKTPEERNHGLSGRKH
jgi:hypothetical protein